MIQRAEIDAKSAEFGVHISNVQRDYVFGWLLFAIFNNPYLAKLLILKGGNCFRKAYFPNTRFSGDLDFSTQAALDLPRFEAEIAECCRVAEAHSGVEFNVDRNTFAEAPRALLGPNVDSKIYKGKVYFVDFSGAREGIELSVRMDVTEFDKLYLPISQVPLIHPYSDREACQVTLRCVAIEEGIASKLKCLLQRRHSYDLYDLVHAAFFNSDIELNRADIVSVFLKKTIFGRSPGSAKQILLGLPMPFFKAAWEKYVTCPVQSMMAFDKAESVYSTFIDQLFLGYGNSGFANAAFYPAEMRNKILDAGRDKKLMRISYQGYERIMEPYALTYKRRKSDGVAQEYLYAWDRSGGSSGTIGIKSLLNPDIASMEVLEETFQPQFEIELSKAGEETSKGYFGGGRTSVSRTPKAPRRTRNIYTGGPKSTVECSYCGRRFTRQTSSTVLKAHKDKHGYPCSGRYGFLVGWK